ncbi:MAG: FAD-dependent oxidoreductase [Candidatus Latescibacterota bacterium]|jgi:ribulose 1,5-bisphosphate synthetase/thiazole synthase
MTEPAAWIDEPARRVPVAYDVDVLVAGGGIAGTMAALAAARHGARTLVIDRFGQLGGNIGPGLWGGGTLHLALKSSAGPADEEQLLNRVGLGGIPEEFHRRVIYARPHADRITPEVAQALEACHLNLDGYRMGTGGGLPGYLVDSQVASHVALEMLTEAGVELLLSVYAGDPILVDGRVRGIFVESKSGRLACRARVVVDATGEADIAFRAGAPTGKVTNPNLGLYYVLGGVDPEAYQRFCAGLPSASADDLAWAAEIGGTAPAGDAATATGQPLLPLLRQAWEAGEFRYLRRVDQAVVRLSMKVGAARAGGLCLADGRTGTGGTADFSDARMVSRMEQEHRELVYGWARFLQRHVAGFADACLLNVSPYLNARGGRYLRGEYPLSGEDLTAQRTFDDVIYLYHDDKCGRSCEVPYRLLLPRGVDGMLAAGRASHVYGPNLRARCFTLLNGQAAGVAAALCSRAGIEPRLLPVRELQRSLLALGSPVTNPRRLRELGLA